MQRQAAIEAARLLVEARRTVGKLTALPEAVRPRSLDDAYAVQAAFREVVARAGVRLEDRRHRRPRAGPLRHHGAVLRAVFRGVELPRQPGAARRRQPAALASIGVRLSFSRALPARAARLYP